MIRAFTDGTGLAIRDGYGQTETGQLTGNPAGEPVRPGSMGRPLPGVKLGVADDELVLADPATDPTFFVAYLDGTRSPAERPWRTGDRVSRDEDGYLYFEGTSRRPDHLLGLPDRPVRGRVRARLARGGRRGRGRRRARRGARRGRPRGGRAPRRIRPGPGARDRAPGARQAPDRAVQVPADRRFRRRSCPRPRRERSSGLVSEGR